ncbi:CAP-Gly domain-containing linker protein 4 isoform X3 [Scleropages formosus]|uniref:CAP-Gly domain-containing linker protein 4 isoform X3 n=1 Tax=Scleropages formosus TaxID=113540 RepID=UPI0010FAC9CB|nr:CAP-Gly domain-containing linker protein 4 isoform X3 [Scleropages formosus]
MPLCSLVILFQPHFKCSSFFFLPLQGWYQVTVISSLVYFTLLALYPIFAVKFGGNQTDTRDIGGRVPFGHLARLTFWQNLDGCSGPSGWGPVSDLEVPAAPEMGPRVSVKLGQTGPERGMTKEDVPESSGGDPVLGKRWSTDPERPVVHHVASAPMPSDCEFSFFDPNEPQCRAILTDPRTTVPELFAVLRQWVPQVQRNISLIGNEILKRGCGVNDRDGLTDMSLLHYCCKAGAPGIGDAEAAACFARQLLSMGAEPSLRSRWTNMSALHYAAYFDVPQLIRVVLQAAQPGEVDATCSDFDFGTALHIAASNLCVAAVKCLLELGANPAFRNEKGQCPADVVPEPLDMPLEMADAAAQAKELRSLLREVLPQPCTPAPPRPPGLLSEKARAQLLSMGIRLGDRVVIAGQKVGTLRFCGSTDFAGGLWAGVELDEAEGKNDGSVAGVQYFACPVRHGIFAPLSKIAKPPEKRRHAPLRRSTPVRPVRLDLSHVTSKINAGGTTTKKAPVKPTASPGCTDGADDPPVAETGALSLSCSSSSSSLDSRHGPPSRPRPFPRQRPPARSRKERAPANSKNTPPPPLTSTAGPPRTRTPSASSSVCEGPPLRLGERVLVVGQRTGIVRFYGKTSFAPGIWLGIELDKPSGKNDGSVGGIQYFSCPPKHGSTAPWTACPSCPPPDSTDHSTASDEVLAPHRPSPRKRSKTAGVQTTGHGRARRGAGGARRVPGGPPARQARTAASACSRARRSSWAAPTRWRSSATWARPTLRRGSGWAWSCAAPRARTMAPSGGAATSAVGRATGSWCGPAGSPTGESTGRNWWMSSAESGGGGLRNPDFSNPSHNRGRVCEA